MSLRPPGYSGKVIRENLLNHRHRLIRDHPAKVRTNRAENRLNLLDRELDLFRRHVTHQAGVVLPNPNEPVNRPVVQVRADVGRVGFKVEPPDIVLIPKVAYLAKLLGVLPRLSFILKKGARD